MRTLTAALVFATSLISAAEDKSDLPLADISGDKDRQTVLAQGTEEVYQGHPTTTLMPDGKTILCVWCINHMVTKEVHVLFHLSKSQVLRRCRLFITLQDILN